MFSVLIMPMSHALGQCFPSTHTFMERVSDKCRACGFNAVPKLSQRAVHCPRKQIESTSPLKVFSIR